MATNIEKLQTRVDDTKDQIEKSKALSAAEKIEKAKALESIISKINSHYDTLRVSATPEQLAEIDALSFSCEEMNLQFNNQFKQDLSSLEEKVVDSAKEAKDNNTKETIEEKSRLKTKRDKIPPGGKKALKVVGGITGAIFLYKGIKSLFSSKDKSSGEKKEGFWNHGIGKGLKYAGIWVASFLGIKWLMDYLSNKENKIDDAEEQVNSYLDQPKQNIEKYESLGDSINDFYAKIWKKETDLGYKDQNYLGSISEDIKLKKGESKESLSGIVPFCIDQDSDNIGDFLGEGDFNEYLFFKDYKSLKIKIKDWSTDKLVGILGPFIFKLESFQTFGIRPGKSVGENLRDWLDDDAESENRQMELNFFFRQYSKVLTYMQDKKTELEYKIAEKIIKSKGYDGNEWPEDHNDQFDIMSEALSDKNFFEKNIKGNSLYNKFLNSNILGSFSILKKQGILTSEPSKILNTEVLNDIDDTTDDILKINNSVTILDTAEQEIDGGLSDNTKEDLLDTCGKLKDDMVNENGTGLIQQHMERLTYMLNMDESNKATFLEETGLSKLVETYSIQIDEVQDKIKNGTATKEDIKSLKDLSVKYFAFKKELNIAMYTIGRIRSDNPDILLKAVNVFLKFTNSFIYAITNGEYGYAALHAVIIGGVLYLFTHPWQIIKSTGKFAIGTLKGGYKVAGWSARKSKLFQPGLRANINKLTNVAQKKSLIKKYILHGDIDCSKTKNRRLIKEIFSIEDLPKDGGKIIEKIMGGSVNGYGELIDKYKGTKGLRKMFLLEKIDGDAKIADKILARSTHKIYSFDNKVLKRIKSIDDLAEVNPNITKILKRMKSIDDLDKLDLLVSDKTFLAKIAGKSNSELKAISKTISNTPFKNLNNANIVDDIISGKVEKLGRKAQILSNKIDKTISGLKPNHSAGNPVLENKIKKLEKFKKELSIFSKTEIETYNKIFDIEPKYMSKILDIGDELKGPLKEEKMGKIINSILSKDGKLLEKTLSEVKLATKYSNLIKDIKVFSKIDIDLHIAKDVGKLFMKIIKTVAKVT